MRIFREEPDRLTPLRRSVTPAATIPRGVIELTMSQSFTTEASVDILMLLLHITLTVEVLQVR